MTDAKEIIAKVVRDLRKSDRFSPEIADAILAALEENGMAVVPRKIVLDLAQSLEYEIEARYGATKDHPAMKSKYALDMSEVLEVRAALTAQEKPE